MRCCHWAKASNKKQDAEFKSVECERGRVHHEWMDEQAIVTPCEFYHFLLETNAPVSYVNCDICLLILLFIVFFFYLFITLYLSTCRRC